MHFLAGAPFSISSAAPMPSSKSAKANPVGSCTPFSFEQASHRFTFCILPSRIWVKKTDASLHLQTSHNMVVQLDHKRTKRFNWRNQCPSPVSVQAYLGSLTKNWRPALARQLSKAFNRALGDWSGFSIYNRAAIDLDHWNDLGRSASKEGFVRDVNVVACQLWFRNSDPQL